MTTATTNETHERSFGTAKSGPSPKTRLQGGRLLPVAGRAFSRLAPRTAGAWGATRFLTPPRARADEFAQDVLAAGKPFHAPLGEVSLAAWSWGKGPAVLLVHGWGGCAGQMTRFVRPLTEAGFRVLAFDAPGHGGSGEGQSSTLQISRAIDAIAAVQGGIHGLIAHSLGAIAAGLAVERGLKVERLAFVGALAQAAPVLPFVASALGFTPRATCEMQNQIERRVGLEFGRLDLPAIGRSLGVTAPRLLVVHDRDDKEVSWNNAPAITDAWHGARLAGTDGLGHKRILRDPDVAGALCDFMGGGLSDQPNERLLAAQYEQPTSITVRKSVSRTE